MRKAIHVITAATLALSSCATDEASETVKRSDITFRTSVGLNSRATEVTSDNINEMWVTAYRTSDKQNEFNNLKFVKEGSDFVCNDQVLSWPKDKELLFFAMNPSIGDPTGRKLTYPYQVTIGNTTGFKLENITPEQDIALQKDVVIGWATASAATHATSGVPMKLAHLLPQIKVAIKNTNKNLVYHIAGIKLANVAESFGGEYEMRESSTLIKGVLLTQSKETTTYMKRFEHYFSLQNTGTEDLTNHCTQGKECGIMPVPQNLQPIQMENGKFKAGQYIAILLNVRTQQGKHIYPAGATDDHTFGWAAISIPTRNWVYGYKYLYTLDLSNGCGVVDPIDPNPEGGGVVEPGGKDPNKGEQIFGEKIKFECTVTPWIDENRGIIVQ